VNIEELKEWMDERFNTQTDNVKGINMRLDKMNERVTNHDRWLWLMRGVMLAVVFALGLFGIKINI